MKPQTIIVNAILAATILLSLTLSSCAGERFSKETGTSYDRTCKIDGIGYGVNTEGNSAVVLDIFPEAIQVGVLTIPDVISDGDKHYIVNGIARLGCSGMEATSVVLPVGMSTIEMLAFSKCENLKSITISGSVCPSASNSAFDSKTLKNAVLIYPTGMELTYPFSGFNNKYEY